MRITSQFFLNPFHGFFFLVILVFFGCKEKAKSFKKDDLIGTYKVEEVFPFDTTLKAKKTFALTKAWTLKLMEHDNFEFIGNNKTVTGYWTFLEEAGKDSMKIFQFLLFQSGLMPEKTVYAHFDKTQILFDSPLWMLDSAYVGVKFERIDK